MGLEVTTRPQIKLARVGEFYGVDLGAADAMEIRRHVLEAEDAFTQEVKVSPRQGPQRLVRRLRSRGGADEPFQSQQ